VLARWSGWGAIPAVFDPIREDYAVERARLSELLGDSGFAAARRSTLNAHYTDAGIAAAMWSAVQALGFTGGEVLEPGCGSGTFVGLAPPEARMTGVEVDPTTAAIAAALYPGARIVCESFADTRAPDGAFDLAIGNVPFAKLGLVDRRHNPAGHSIHNHFLIKSLHLVRPGGFVVALTSRYTLDARNPAARREMAELGELVTALRLPTGAHQRAAGTQVVTDLLVLRRLQPGQRGNGSSWELATPMTLPGAGGERTDIEINRYFHNHPEHVLGTLQTGRGAFGGNDLVVEQVAPLDQLLATTLAQAVDQARQTGRVFQPATAAAAPARAALVHGHSDQREGLIQQAEGGGFTRIVSGAAVPFSVPASQSDELRALLGLRDTTVALLEAEAATVEDTAEIAGLRAQLGQRYGDYADRYGPIKRFTWRPTGRTDSETGEPKLARIRPAQGGFKLDPFSPVVRALEVYDETTATATRAAIFEHRVVAPRAPRRGADSPADALAVCLDTHGEVRLDIIAGLLGTTPQQARGELGTLVFDDPTSGRLSTAAEYLSGNVRVKLAAAAAAADEDPRFAPNVAALREIIPADLLPGEIHARLGAPWIAASYVEQFLRETLDDRSLRVEHPGGTIWAVSGSKYGVAATSTWGTLRKPAPELAEAVLEQRVIIVRDELEDGRRIINVTDTLAAQEKAAELDARFADWIWEDPARAAALARTYNDTFNAIVLRNYDDVELSLPGVALTFTPHRHQVAAVARIIHEPAVGLFHEVGAGKTAEMVMGTMELRRLGMVRKPAIVVPNHMLEQFAGDFLGIYPRANVLTAGRDDLAGDRRREFVGRAATGDWDAIIMTRSAFERLPMSPEHQRAYLDQEAERLRLWIENVRASGGERSSLTIKRMEATLARAEERLKDTLAGRKDAGITFEMTGIDYLVVDEAHDYKNLRTVSNIPGVAIEGSKRASDLDMKLSYLRGQHGDRVGTLATATPIANSVAEAYTMQRYLQPELLAQAGVEDFDSWAAAFGEVVTGIELSPDGGRFRMQSRFARFKNVPELLRLWHVSADVKTAEDLNLAVPLIAARPDGQRLPEVVTTPGSTELAEVMAETGRRADRIRAGGVDPTQDNMLKIGNDGRAAALDLRLLGLSTDEATKLDAAADRIAATWQRHREARYPARGGGEHPVPGALQLVFCDLGTPNDDGRWEVYSTLRSELHRRGLPDGSVRFMHEARNDVEKGMLFRAAREGHVAVLIGSTQRMGVGTNVQDRLVALHHLDCPWRPADLAQRDGRGIRQGNLNPEIEVLRYVTEGSFDGYLWQTVARKAGFIAQVMRGSLDVREIEDVGDAALSYDEVKALATGDPRVLEKAKLDAEVTRLERLERAHYRGQSHLTHAVDVADRAIVELDVDAAAVEVALGRRVDTRGEAFRATVAGATYTSRADAGRALLGEVLEHPAAPRSDGRTATVGRLGGFELGLRAESGGGRDQVVLTLVDVPRSAVVVDRDKVTDLDPAGLIARLENKVTGLDRLVDRIADERAEHQRERDRAAEQLDKPFARSVELADARAQAALLAKEMADLAQPPPAPAAEALDPAAATSALPEADRSSGAEMTGLPAGAATVLAELRAQHGAAGGDVAGQWRRDREGVAVAHEADRQRRDQGLDVEASQDLGAGLDAGAG
jgi:N12 class adenine-specific DNA methylase